MIGTFLLVFGILAIFDNAAPARRGSAALLVGLLVFGIGLSLGGPTGYAINPGARPRSPHHARDSPIAGKGGSDWGYAWMPVVGPSSAALSGRWRSISSIPADLEVREVTDG